MFTGLIESTANLLELSNNNTILKIALVDKDNASIKIGDSISINGCCLSVIEKQDLDKLTFQLSHETLQKTKFSHSKIGDVLNVERAMLLAQRLDGHIVTGHIDGVGVVKKFDRLGDYYDLRVEIDKSLSKYVILKGSICIDGVSLTVNEVTDFAEVSTISCTLVPITLKKTNLNRLQPSDIVNIEVDILAKQLERLAKFC